MPCVNLAHVPALRAMVKPLTVSLFDYLNSRKTPNTQSNSHLTNDSASATAPLSDEKTIKIPHPRPVLPSHASPHAVTSPVASSSTARRLPSSYFRRSARPSRADLINAESRLGSTLFGPIPEGHRREFFHDQKNIWIWHEDWTDENRHDRELTIRYEVRTSGVYKKIAAGKYFKLEGDELENFRKATHAYLYLVKKHLYNQPTLVSKS